MRDKNVFFVAFEVTS